MRLARRSLGTGAEDDRQASRSLGILRAWRLQAYGYTLAAVWVASVLYLYNSETWLVDGKGTPLYRDFTCFFAAGSLALHGDTALIFIPGAFLNAQDVLVGSGNSLYDFWAYPPTILLILAPLALLPYATAFLIW